MSELLCERLKRLRRARGLTQTQIADRLNISHVAIAQWERAFSSPHASRLPPLAHILGVTIDYLLTGREAPYLAVLQRAVLSSPHPDERLLALVRGKELEPA